MNTTQELSVGNESEPLSANEAKADVIAKAIIRKYESSVKSMWGVCEALHRFFDDGWDKHLRRANGTYVGPHSQAYFARAFKLNKSVVSRMVDRGRMTRGLKESNSLQELTIVNNLTDGAVRPLLPLLGAYESEIPDVLRRSKEIAQERRDRRERDDAAKQNREVRPGRPGRIADADTRAAAQEVLDPTPTVNHRVGKASRKVYVSAPPDDEPTPGNIPHDERLICVAVEPLQRILDLLAYLDTALDECGTKHRASDMRARWLELHRVASAAIVARDHKQGALA